MALVIVNCQHNVNESCLQDTKTLSLRASKYRNIEERGKIIFDFWPRIN